MQMLKDCSISLSMASSLLTELHDWHYGCDSCLHQDLSKEQAETHKVLVQPALEAAANATVNVLSQLIKSVSEQVLLPICAAAAG